MIESAAHCLRLTRILSAIAEANVGQPINERLANAESLAVKFISHCISAQALCRGTRLQELKADFTDPTSINVIIRAALESVLTFYYLFAATSDEDELNFRHDAWMLADLMARQEFTPTSEEGRRKLAEESAFIERLQVKLRANRVFAALTPKQQNGVLFKQRWKMAGWAEIGKEMGLDENHADTFYSYLCSYAHSGYLSVLQVQQARTADAQKLLVAGSLGVLTIAMAHMIRLFSTVFPRCADALKQIPEAEPLIQMWITVGASTMGSDAASGSGVASASPERD